jgi:hypothetical protein
LNTQGFKDSTVTDVKYDHLLKIASNKPIEIGFWKIGLGTNAKYLLKVTDIKQIFEVDENFLKSLFKTRKEMLGTK